MTIPEQPLSVRTAFSKDCKLLVELMEEFYREEELPFNARTAQEALLELVETPELGAVLLLIINEEVLGYLVVIQSFILEFGGRQIFLDEFFIHEKWRGRGLGQQALAAAENFARERGCRALRLEVARTNARALRMYERAGFERHDRFTMTKVLS